MFTKLQTKQIKASLKSKWEYQSGRLPNGISDVSNRIYTSKKVRELIEDQPYCAPGCTFQVIIKGLPLKVVSNG